MHLETSPHKSDDAPLSRSDSQIDFFRNIIFDDSDHADDESSDSDDELPRNVEPVMNPVNNIEALIIENNDDDNDSQSPNEAFYDQYWNDFEYMRGAVSDLSSFNGDEENALSYSENNTIYDFPASASDISECEYENDNTQSGTPIKPENDQSKDYEGGTSNNEEKDAVKGVSKMPEIEQFMIGASCHLGLKQKYPNWYDGDSSDCVFILCDDDSVEPSGTSKISHSSPSIKRSFEARDSPVEDSLTYDLPANSGYLSSNGVPGFTQTSGYVSTGNGYDTTQSSYGNSDTPAFEKHLSSYYNAPGNPGYATVQFMPYLTIPHLYYNVPSYRNLGLFSPIYNARYSRNYPSYHSIPYHTLNNFGYLGQYSKNNLNNYGYAVRYPMNYGIPDYRGYTGYVSANFRGGPIYRSFPGIHYNIPRFVVPYHMNNIAPTNYGYYGPPQMESDTEINTSDPGSIQDQDLGTPNNQGNTGQQTTNDTASTNLDYSGSYSINNRDNTSSQSTNNHSTTDNYGYVAPTQLDDSTSNDNEPRPHNKQTNDTEENDNTTNDTKENDNTTNDTKENDNTTNDTKENDNTTNNTKVNDINIDYTCFKMPQNSGNGSSDNHDFETLQSTNSIAPNETGNQASSSTVYASGDEIPVPLNEFTPSIQRGTFYSDTLRYSNAPFANYFAHEHQNYQDVSGNVNDAQSSDEASAFPASLYDAVTNGHGFRGYGFRGHGFRGHGFRSHGFRGHGAQDSISYDISNYNRYGAANLYGYRAPGVNGYRTPGFYGFTDPNTITNPRFDGYTGHSSYNASEFAGNSVPELDGNSASDLASAMAGSGAPDTSDFSTQNSPTYPDPSNSDQSSPSSSSYWIGYEFNLNTIFDSNGCLIDRHDMEETVSRFLVPDERYIPVVRLQSEAGSNNGDVPAARSEHGSSLGQRGRPPPISPRSRNRGRGRGRGRGVPNFSKNFG